MMGIKTVLFDFGGVLVNLDKQLCLNEFEKLGVSNLGKLISNYTQSGLFLALEKGTIDAAEFRNEIRKLSSQNLSDEAIDAAWNSFLLEIPEFKLELLLELKKHYRVALLSNTNCIHFEQKAHFEFSKNGLGVSDYFDTCYLSYELGMAKPSEDIFNYVLEKENIEPHEILFLDDGELNIETAKKLGFSCYLVKEKEDFRHLFKNISIH